ncbi:MAG: hypothetical protein GXP11_09855 [Gammaproteobacteria bacterium]|nr:hypothetical protein [Gammaproteobacteria bacterium]
MANIEISTILQDGTVTIRDTDTGKVEKIHIAIHRFALDNKPRLYAIKNEIAAHVWTRIPTAKAAQ